MHVHAPVNLPPKRHAPSRGYRRVAPGDSHQPIDPFTRIRSQSGRSDLSPHADAQNNRQIEPSERAVSLIEPTPSEPDAAGGCFQRMLVYFEEYKTEWVADR